MRIKNLIVNSLNQRTIIQIKESRFFNDANYSIELIRRNMEFKDKYTGKRCFILGNGPSLKDFDLGLLADEYTFSVNQISRRDDFSKLKTNFHCWQDKRFFDIDKNRPEDLELLEVMRKVNTENNKPIVFYSIEAFEMIKKYRLDDILNIYYLALDSMPHKVLEKRMDFAHLTMSFPTVVQSIICLAVYMGFEEIYLLGCDCTGFITIAETHLNSSLNNVYGYTLTENEKKRMKNASVKTSIRDELNWYVKLFDDYELIKQYCNRNRVKLFNATDGGLLECIDRIEIKKVLCADEQ